MTAAQKNALRWLHEHNGDGVFDNNGVLLAAGELAMYTRRTWNELQAAGKIEFYKVNAKGATRVRIKKETT